MRKLILALKVMTAIVSFCLYIFGLSVVFYDIREMGMIVYHIPLVGVLFANAYLGVFLSFDILDEIKETRS